MEQLKRLTPDDSPTIVYQTQFRISRIVVFSLLAVLSAGLGIFAVKSPVGCIAGGIIAAAILLAAFRRRRVCLDLAAGTVRESNLYLGIGRISASGAPSAGVSDAGRIREMKLSDYGSISIAVQANDNEAEDGKFMSLFEVNIVGSGKSPILLFATQDRLAAEREVEFLARRLNWVVGWHSRSYGQ